MTETLIGIDFAGPSSASQQRRKIMAVQAHRLGPCEYRVRPDGFNDRLRPLKAPGWTAEELREALIGDHKASVVAFDFPFSLPAELLTDAAFARRVGRDQPFGTWAEFNRFVCEHLSLECPLNFKLLAAWKDKALWKKRATDVLSGGQPPLKHQFQALFNMTLLGNTLLGSLAASGSYRVEPFDKQDDKLGTVIEIYPGFTMRQLGRADYKRDPDAAINTVLDHCGAKGIRIEVDPGVRAVCETYGMNRKTPDPDASDALIALCTAILHREGLCQPVTGAGDAGRASLEGAIWGPSATI